MNFLRGIIARGSSSAEAAAPMAMAAQANSQFDGDDLYPESSSIEEFDTDVGKEDEYQGTLASTSDDGVETGDFGDDEEWADDCIAMLKSADMTENGSSKFAAATTPPADSGGGEVVSASPKIWELFDDEENEPAAATDSPSAAATTDQELARQALKGMKGRAKTPGTTAPSGGRAKTRLLGFNHDVMEELDVFHQSEAEAATKPTVYPVGWLVVIEGPGRGASFTLHNGVSKIGRGEDQSIRLDFGDDSISRDNHAAIAYDEEQNTFYLGHGGKANLVRRNGHPVLTTEELSNADLIRIGETQLRFVAFCTPEFAWDLTGDGGI